MPDRPVTGHGYEIIEAINVGAAKTIICAWTVPNPKNEVMWIKAAAAQPHRDEAPDRVLTKNSEAEVEQANGQAIWAQLRIKFDPVNVVNTRVKTA